MEIHYYSIETEKSLEYFSDLKSEIDQKIKSLDLSSNFQLLIRNPTNGLEINRPENIYHIVFHEFSETEHNTTYVKEDRLENVTPIIHDYIFAMDPSIVKNRMEASRKQSKREQEEKYKKWKADFDVQQKKDRFKTPLKFVLAGVIVFALFFGGSALYSGDYIFWFQNTTKVNAVVIDHQKIHIGRGFYKQKIFFEYEYNDKVYRGDTYVGKRFGWQDEGNIIQVKISTSHPETHKVTGHY